MSSTETHTAPRTVTLDVTGMTCASCVARVEKKLRRVGDVDAVVNLALERASVQVSRCAARRSRRKGRLWGARAGGSSRKHIDPRPRHKRRGARRARQAGHANPHGPRSNPLGANFPHLNDPGVAVPRLAVGDAHSRDAGRVLLRRAISPCDLGEHQARRLHDGHPRHDGNVCRVPVVDLGPSLRRRRRNRHDDGHEPRRRFQPEPPRCARNLLRVGSGYHDPRARGALRASPRHPPVERSYPFAA